MRPKSGAHQGAISSPPDDMLERAGVNGSSAVESVVIGLEKWQAYRATGRRRLSGCRSRRARQLRAGRYRDVVASALRNLGTDVPLRVVDANTLLSLNEARVVIRIGIGDQGSRAQRDGRFSMARRRIVVYVGNGIWGGQVPGAIHVPLWSGTSLSRRGESEGGLWAGAAMLVASWGTAATGRARTWRVRR